MRITFLALVVCASVARAQSDPCSWLTTDRLSQQFNGAKFDAPQKVAAPPAYAGQTPGTLCIYNNNRTPTVELTVYVDRSTAEATDTFDRLKLSFPPASKPNGLGDDAYFDKNHGLHVRKGSTRFFLRVMSPYQERDATTLATIVVSKI